jgi:hypothetical protein
MPKSQIKRVGLLSPENQVKTVRPLAATEKIQAPNRSAARALAFAISTSRFLGGACVSSAQSRRLDISAISSTAATNKASFAFDGLLNPLIFLTNWSEAARISSPVTGGSKLKRVLIFLHIGYISNVSKAIVETLSGAVAVWFE